MHNGEVSILVLAEVNSNKRKLPLEENLYHQTDGWYKTVRINTAQKKQTTGNGPFQSGGTATMYMNEIACRVLDSRNDPREFGFVTHTLNDGTVEEINHKAPL